MKKKALMGGLAALLAAAIFALAQYTPTSKEAGSFTDGWFGDDVGITDDLAVTGLVTFATQTITITNTHAAGGPTLTPTASVIDVAFAAGGASPATASVANATYAGQKLTIINSSTGSLVIADGANIQSTGALTLGQWDSAVFVGDQTATNWVMITTSNN